MNAFRTFLSSCIPSKVLLMASSTYNPQTNENPLSCSFDLVVTMDLKHVISITNQ